jgi:ABC-type Fe3+/spermidine/putrescine transport system ATPase subunit
VMNFLPGRAVAGGVEVPGLGLVRGERPAGLSAGAAAVAAVRPERLSLVGAGAPALDNRITGTVAAMAYHGLDVQLHVATGALPAPILVRLTADAAEAAPLAPGTPVTLGWAAADTRILAA